MFGAKRVGAQPGPGELAVSPQRVLVLGAGMAGLTAALALRRRGHDGQVIERQNRVGARLLSTPLKGERYSETVATSAPTCRGCAAGCAAGRTP
ncbi:MAG: FAD/NAD(P)-binding protein [Thermomicrobiales bacterium]